MVHRRLMVARTQFRKLPDGAMYWLNTAPGVAPSIKVGQHAKATAFASGQIVDGLVADASVVVIKVPQALL